MPYFKTTFYTLNPDKRFAIKHPNLDVRTVDVLKEKQIRPTN